MAKKSVNIHHLVPHFIVHIQPTTHPGHNFAVWVALTPSLQTMPLHAETGAMHNDKIYVAAGEAFELWPGGMPEALKF